MAVMLSTLGIVWIYIIASPMGFLEGGYPVWAAKQQMLRECDLGTVVVFGDSRAEAGIIPERLPVKASNLTVGAATPIELSFFVDRALRCRQVPQRVIISLSDFDFMEVSQYLWENAARYGVFGYRELAEIAAASAQLNDSSVDATKTRDGLHGTARNLLYALRFPALYFNSLIQGQVFRRYSKNQSVFAEVLRQRGYVAYRNKAENVAPKLARFQALVIQDYYFDRTLAALNGRGIPVDFVVMPVSREISESDGGRAEFAEYLRAYTRRYANFHVIGERAQFWPSEFFVDGGHLDPRGAEIFSDGFSGCLKELTSAAATAGGLKALCDPDAYVTAEATLAQ